MFSVISRRARGELIECESGRDAGVVPVEYTYSSDGDTNGVVYALGTDFGAVTFANPFNEGKLPIYISPIAIAGLPESVTDRATGVVHSGFDTVSNFLRFDFGPLRKLRLEKYSMRNRSDSTATIPTTVRVLGSHDGATLTQIGSDQTHSNTGLSQWNTKTPAGTIPYRYIYFRSMVNSSNNGYVTCGEVEMYGSFYLSP